MKLRKIFFKMESYSEGTHLCFRIKIRKWYFAYLYITVKTKMLINKLK